MRSDRSVLRFFVIAPIDPNRARRAGVFLRCLEQHRQILKSSIVHQTPECLDADEPFTDVRMAIDPAGERLLRVVEMKDLEPFEADLPIEQIERRRVSIGRCDVVAGGQQMTGVEADAQPRVPFRAAR